MSHEQMKNRIVNWQLVTSLLLILLTSHIIWAEEPKGDKQHLQKDSPQQLVAKLKSAVNLDYESKEPIMKALRDYGKDSIPAIKDGLKESENILFGLTLIQALAGIEGDESKKLLMELGCQKVQSQVSREALGYLENTPINFPLSKEQFDFLIERVKTDHIFGAGLVARILGKCKFNITEKLCDMIIERFKQEVISPTNLGPMHGSYVSPRVYALNQFLLSFSYLGNPATKPLTKELQQDNKEVVKWIYLALGITGDKSVAEQIKQVVEKDPDTSVRAVAVRSYARSAGIDAIPLLETLTKDKTESEYDRYPDGTPVYPIRLVAQDELVDLKRKIEEDKKKEEEKKQDEQKNKPEDKQPPKDK